MSLRAAAWLALLVPAVARAEDPPPGPGDRQARTGRILTYAGVVVTGVGGAMLGAGLGTRDPERTRARGDLILAGATTAFAGDATLMAGITTEAIALADAVPGHPRWIGQVGLGVAAAGALAFGVLGATAPADATADRLTLGLAVAGGAFAVGTGFAIGQAARNDRTLRRLPEGTRRALYGRGVGVVFVPTWNGQSAGIAIAGPL